MMAEDNCSSAEPDKTPLRVSARLYNRKRRIYSDIDRQTSVAPLASPGTSDNITPSAKRMRRYREKLQAEGHYAKYLEKQRKKAKEYRANRSEEKKKADNEKNRLRAQKYRQKKKEKGEPVNANPTVNTRSSLAAKRKKERERKRKYRSALTPQKRAAINLKRRKRVHTKTDAAVLETMSKPANKENEYVKPASSKGFLNRSTKAKAVRRVKQFMPKSPSKYADVAEFLINVTSPRRREALDSKGLYITKERKGMQARENYHKEMQNKFKETKASRKKAKLQTKADYCRFFLDCNRGMKIADLRKMLNVSWNYVRKCLYQLDRDQPISPKKRSDAVPAELIQIIQNFLNRGDIAREEPAARNVGAKDQQPRRYMCKTMKEAWVQFKEETSTSISYSKFCCFRPKHTKCMAKDRFKTCCCEYCENITLKKKAVNSVLQTAGHGEMFLGSKFAIADMTCCAPNPVLHLHNKACIDRECENCGISKFHEVMVPMLDNLSDTQTTWSAWRSEKSTYKNKQGMEVTTNKQVLVKIDGPFSQLIAELEEDLHTFAWHLANYQWQQRQFDKLTRDVPTGWLVMCMDYGENFTCAYQDEAQGAHWSRQQITIHPVICYYRCPDHPEVTTQETFCFISNDLKHDSHGVQHFQQQALQTLLERGINVTQIIHFSDGCPSQYKGKASFIDLSFAKDDTGIPTEKHFFGSRHGKGPCDREIGVVKRLARQAVLRRKCIIATAQDLYEYGCSSLTKPADNSHSHTCRQFFFVREGTIVRDRPDRTGGKGIPGTRKLHCVRGHSPFIVSYKERSCFCEACVTLEGECTNKSFVGDWKEVSLKVNRRQK